MDLVSDKSKKVDDIVLDADILSGAVIVQTSLTGENWITDRIYTDIRGEESVYDINIYNTNNIQQVNGCYYRVIIVYKLEKKNEVDKTITNWSGSETEVKKCAEVYEFYLIDNSELMEDATLPTDQPRKNLGAKINTGTNNGYSGNEVIDDADPHFGWEIGQFFVNGYTRETVGVDGNSVFLKNVGDRVTLWFNLEQDIGCLNANDKLIISEDKDGYDQYFEIEKTNFKHGTLIIRYTDYEGVVHEPVIYTDYLAANARTGANTIVELFEEGDYEVALNYEIKDSSKMNGYSNYRIYFEFSIRNGNCMVFPFDIMTGAELSNNSITENGFLLDMAKSRYLTIDVKREILKDNGNGYTLDERFNRPAQDGEAYYDEGIYTFTVKNLYTDESTEKVIYVGNDPIYLVLSSGYSLTEINDLLSQGAEIQPDGALVLEMVDMNDEVTEKEDTSTIKVTSIETSAEVEADEIEEKKGNNVLITVLSVSASIAVIVVIVLWKRKKAKTGDNVSEEAEG